MSTLLYLCGICAISVNETHILGAGDGHRGLTCPANSSLKRCAADEDHLIDLKRPQTQFPIQQQQEAEPWPESEQLHQLHGYQRQSNWS